MPQELLYMRQLLGGGGQGWLQVTLLAFLFLILVFKPERIERPGLFKVACLLFVLSIVLPSVVTMSLSLVAGGAMSSYFRGSGMASEVPILVSLITLFEPALLAASVMSGLMALFPVRGSHSTTKPARHPLE